MIEIDLKEFNEMNFYSLSKKFVSIKYKKPQFKDLTNINKDISLLRILFDIDQLEAENFVNTFNR